MAEQKAAAPAKGDERSSDSYIPRLVPASSIRNLKEGAARDTSLEAWARDHERRQRQARIWCVVILLAAAAVVLLVVFKSRYT